MQTTSLLGLMSAVGTPPTLLVVALVAGILLALFILVKVGSLVVRSLFLLAALAAIAAAAWFLFLR